MTWSRTKKLLILGVFLTIAALAIYYVTFSSIKSKNENISAILNDLALETKKETLLKSIKSVAIDSAPARKKMESYFIGQDEIVKFLDFLGSLGKMSGAELEINNLGLEERAPTPAEAYQLLKLNIEAKGSFRSVYHFLTLLESVPFQINFAGVEMRTADTGVNGSKAKKNSAWKGSFNISVFKLK